MKHRRWLSALLCVAMLAGVLPGALVLPAAAADTKTKDPMDNYVLGTVYEERELSYFADLYSYAGGWVDGLSINLSGVDKANLALQFQFYIENNTNKGNLDLLKNCTSKDIYFGNGDWSQKIWWFADNNLKCADGSALKAGEWNDILLPFSTSVGGLYDTFSTTSFDRFWFQFTNSEAITDNYTIKLKNVVVVDTSRSKNAASAKDPMDNFVLGTVYEEKELAYDAANFCYSGWVDGLSIDLSGVNKANLALQFQFYIENNTNKGNLDLLKNADSKNVYFCNGDWSPKIWWFADNNMKCADGSALKAGEWNNILLPFSASVGGLYDTFSTTSFDRFWFQIDNAVNKVAITDDYTIKLKNVVVVDTSRKAATTGGEGEGGSSSTDKDVMNNYIVGNVYNARQLTRSTNTSGHTVYGMGWRTDMDIDLSGIDKSNLALQFRLYIENLDNPGEISLLKNASSKDVKLCESNLNNPSVKWTTDKLTRADGTAIKAGEWNDILLPFSTATGYANFSAQKFTCFWFELNAGKALDDTYVIRLSQVNVVDTSREKQKESETVYDTTYLAGEIPFTLNQAIVGNGASTSKIVVEAKGFNAIDVSGHDLSKLRLAMDVEVTPQTDDANLDALGYATGQIELTSSGTCDHNEIAYTVSNLGWKEGKNTVMIALTSGSATGGTIDYSAINYMRIYIDHWDATTAGTVSLKISNVRIVDVSESTTLPSIFSDGMVFQQNKPMNLWGYGKAGDTVTATLFDKNNAVLETKTATIAESGRWDVAFSARKGGYDAYSIKVEPGEGLDPLYVRDIVIGELWLASGQSNMELKIARDMDREETLAAANNQYIRLYTEPNRPSTYSSTEQPLDPVQDIDGVVWGYGNNKSYVNNTSAVGYYFAAKLQAELDVPVGLIDATLGATVIEAWLPREAIADCTELKTALERLGKYYDEEFWSSTCGTMSTLYNTKIGPLAGLNIAGTIWYQGESNSEYSEIYGYAINVLKESWSEIFGFENGDMPLIFTQVAPYRYKLSNAQSYQHAGWLAMYMEQGWKMSEDKNTSMLTIYDLPIDHMKNGESSDPIHPRCKKPVGERFAAAALNMVYGGNKEYTAPVYSSMQINEAEKAIYLTFDHVGDGLKTTDGSSDVRGFTICGSDGVYVPANAKIVNSNTVKVWNNEVNDPKNVTYAFYNFTQEATLANSSDIPASPFRTVEITDTALKRDSSQTYFNVQEWMHADADAWVFEAAKEADNATQRGVSVQPAFKVTNGACTYSTEFFAEGTGSVKVTATDRSTVTLEPVLTYSNLELDWSLFNSLSFRVMNPNAADVSLTVQVVSGGQTYTVGKAITLSKLNNGFLRYTVDMTELYDKDGKKVTDTAAVWKTKTRVLFTMSAFDDAVFFDDFAFGMTDAVVSNETTNANHSVLLPTYEDLKAIVDKSQFTESDYTAESWAAYMQAKTAAQNANSVSLLQVRNLVDKLKAAENGLTLKPEVLLGDVDGDGEITSTDARLALQCYAGKISADKLNAAAADVDGDGEITSTDARLILQRYVGKISKFPAEQ